MTRRGARCSNSTVQSRSSRERQAERERRKKERQNNNERERGGGEKEEKGERASQLESPTLLTFVGAHRIANAALFRSATTPRRFHGDAYTRRQRLRRLRVKTELFTEFHSREGVVPERGGGREGERGNAKGNAGAGEARRKIPRTSSNIAVLSSLSRLLPAFPTRPLSGHNSH